MKKLIAIAVVLVASVAQANDYKTTKKQELPSKTKQVVEFKEHWTWNNKIKKKMQPYDHFKAEARVLCDDPKKKLHNYQMVKEQDEIS